MQHYLLSDLLQIKIFYWILSKLSKIRLSFGQSDFRLLDRKVVNVIIQSQEHRKFLRGLVEWVGFTQIGIEYEVEERHAGRSKMSYFTRLSFAIDGILSYSFLPLRWSLFCGLFVAALCFGYGLFVVILGVLKLFGYAIIIPSGWVTLAAAITFLASVQLIAIGILSEYLGRVYEQVKGRPIFVINETSD